VKIVSIVPSTTFASGIAVADFATYLKQTYADDTTNIDLCFTSAVQYVEGILGMILSTKAVKLIGSTWSDGKYDIEIYGSLSAITVNYYDADNANQTLTLATGERWLERTDKLSGTLVLNPATFPVLYDRKDAIRITLTLAADDTFTSLYNMIVFQLGAYFYDCRTNDKEPQMTVVDKMLMAVREKTF
jgi:hypothetical protein